MGFFALRATRLEAPLLLAEPSPPAEEEEEEEGGAHSAAVRISRTVSQVSGSEGFGNDGTEEVGNAATAGLELKS